VQFCSRKIAPLFNFYILYSVKMFGDGHNADAFQFIIIMLYLLAAYLQRQSCERCARQLLYCLHFTWRHTGAVYIFPPLIRFSLFGSPGPTPDIQNITAECFYTFSNVLLHAVEYGQYGNNAENADRDTQQGQGGTQFVCPQ